MATRCRPALMKMSFRGGRSPECTAEPPPESRPNPLVFTFLRASCGSRMSLRIARRQAGRMDMVRFLGVFVLFSLVPTVTIAQEYRGTILGRVFDPQSGVLPGATVVVTNENTNVSDQTVTEADGAYIVPLLIP